MIWNDFVDKCFIPLRILAGVQQKHDLNCPTACFIPLRILAGVQPQIQFSKRLPTLYSYRNRISRLKGCKLTPNIFYNCKLTLADSSIFSMSLLLYKLIKFILAFKSRS